MELKSYVKYLSSIKSFKGDILVVTEAAFISLSKKQTPILQNEIIDYLLELDFVVKKEDAIVFENHASLLLTTLYFLQGQIKENITSERLLHIVTLISKESFAWKRKLIGYSFYDLSYLLLNQIYKFNFCQFIIARNNETPKRFQMSFFDIFPFLDNKIDELCEALLIISNGIKAEDNYVTFHQNLIEKSSLTTEFGYLLISHSKNLEEKSLLFVPPAFVGITSALGIENSLCLLVEFFKSDTIEKNRLGLNCLQQLHGRVDTFQKVEPDILLSLQNLEKIHNDSLQADLIITYGLLIDKLQASRDKLTFFAKTVTGEKSLSALAYMVAQNMVDEFDQEWFQASMRRLEKLPSLNLGVIRNLGFGFSRVQDTHPEAFLNYLDNFITIEDNNLVNLDGFKHNFQQIADNNLIGLESLLTKYFNSDNFKFQIAATKICNILFSHKVKELAFSRELLNSLTIYDIEFILHKVAGFVFSEEHLQSLIYSLTFYEGERKEEVADLIIDIFTDYIIYNYPSSLDYLNSKLITASDFQKKIIERVNNFDQTISKPKKAKPLELGASPKRIQLFLNQFQERFNEEKSTEPFKEPSFLDMVTKISMKKGRYFFSRDDLYQALKDQYSNKAELKSFSSSFTMPTGVMTDPIGQEYNRYLWRTFKRQSI